MIPIELIDRKEKETANWWKETVRRQKVGRLPQA